MSPEALKLTIEKKRLKEYFLISPKVAIAGFFMVCAICFSLLNTLPYQYLYTWLLFAFLVLVFNTVVIVLFRKNKDSVLTNIVKWQLLIAVNSLFIGLSWGVSSSVFYGVVSGSLQPYIVLVSVILLSSYFPVLVNYYLSFSVFAISFVLPLVYQLINSESSVDNNIGLILTTYLISMLAFARWFNKREFERLRLQTELYEQNDKVKEANDSKSRFLASASHDLRQPLQALGFYIVMLSDFLREPRKKALFDKTLKAYQALEDLLNQLLNISKLNANLVDIVKTNFSVNELFEKLKNDYELRAMDKGLSIEFVTGDFFGYSDVVSVERILRNLLENSLRYTDQGFIKAHCQKINGRLVFEIVDSGIGIEQTHIDKIFNEFYQVKNPERDRSKGFGLGLYAVERLARLLETKILVSSSVGKGSLFSIELEEGMKPQIVDQSSSELLIGDKILEDKVILLIDDDDVVLDSISRLFLSWDCQILTADNYNDAINIITQEEIIPDLLIVDYRLPNHRTGVELVEEICALAKITVPAVILTGDTGEESLTHINQSGLSFMHKPADPNKLKKRVKSLLI